MYLALSNSKRLRCLFGLLLPTSLIRHELLNAAGGSDLLRPWIQGKRREFSKESLLSFRHHESRTTFTRPQQHAAFFALAGILV
jgi:hypothetical protein